MRLSISHLSSNNVKAYILIESVILKGHQIYDEVSHLHLVVRLRLTIRKTL